MNLSCGFVEGIDWSTAQDIMQCAITRRLKRKSVDEVTHVGIDEKSFGKEQHNITVVADFGTSHALEVTPARNTESADILRITLSLK